MWECAFSSYRCFSIIPQIGAAATAYIITIIGLTPSMANPCKIFLKREYTAFVFTEGTMLTLGIADLIGAYV